MKPILTSIMIIFAGCLSIALPAQAATETYTLDPHHTAVEWQINHFGFSNPSGKWFVNGTLVLDETQPQNSKVKVTIPVAAIVTGIPELDTHLKGQDFFDVKQFPTATFESTKVDLTGNNTAKVAGILTVHGVSKPVDLNVVLNKIGVNPFTQKKTVGFTASTTLKRADFGLKTALPGVGDEVKITIEAEANLASSST